MMTLAANGYLSVWRLVDTGSSSYYVDSASTSHLNGLTTRGYITSGESGSNGSIQVKDGSGTTNVLFSGSGVANSYIDGYNFGIANSSPSATLEVGETLGDSTWALANTWNTRSDVRFKENIVEVDRALEKIASITGYYYNSKTGSDRSRQIGVVAQEIDQVFPEVVSTDTDGYKAVDYGRLTAVLIEAVKELKTENDLLRERVANLEAR